MDKYTWTDVGSSFLPGELIAAFLWAQLEEATPITTQRLLLWERYHEAFANLEAQDKIRRPIVPQDCEHNAHMYYLLLHSLGARTKFIASLRSKGTYAVFHYGVVGSMQHTNALSDRLVRLPLWPDLGKQQQLVIDAVLEAARDTAPTQDVVA